MDRCALFVDAGYMLADGAKAVHGTSSRDSVSWDYAGLLRFLASLSADRTGQQLLRCYWYETSADGLRTPEHDTLADLPGLTLRLGRVRPGQRAGVEAEIHRDLITLASNRAVSDVLLVSAEEDLAQVISDVQDLGIRVMIAHISADGNWTVSRSLRQQCDDVIQIDSTQLQPYAELIVGAEPARYDEPYAVGAYGGKPLANGHAASAGASGRPELPSGFAGSHPATSPIFTAPVVAEYQPPVLPSAGPPPAPSPSPPAGRPLAPSSSAPAAGAGSPEPGARGMHRSHAADDSPLPPAPQPFSSSQPLSGSRSGAQASSAQISGYQAGQSQRGEPQTGLAQTGQGQIGQGQIGQGQIGQGQIGERQIGERQIGEPLTGQPRTSRPGPPRYPESDPDSFRSHAVPAPAASSARPGPPAPPALDRSAA
ncbi:MAG: NYN domain-containing protein, partial [Kitasatospora sp.]|nr:NYN domain-containing protein [Kitasatospora sp.]